MKKNILIIGLIVWSFLLLPANVLVINYWLKSYNFIKDKYFLSEGYKLQCFNPKYVIVSKSKDNEHEFWTFANNEVSTISTNNNKLVNVSALAPEGNLSWGIHRKTNTTHSITINNEFYLDFNIDGLYEYKRSNKKTYISVKGNWIECIDDNLELRTAKTISNNKYLWNNNKWVLVE